VYGKRVTYPFSLPSLPYGDNELAVGGISELTVRTHHKAHNQAYVTKMNLLIGELNDPELMDKTLEELLVIPTLAPEMYDLIAQSYNHMLYFHGMQPVETRAMGWASDKPDEHHEDLRQAIEKEWKSFDDFKSSFTNIAVTHFGSGWVWLVQEVETGRLEIRATHDAKCLDLCQYQPLLVLDVWEHAYYLDYKGKRADYVNKWWDLVNWHMVAERMINKKLVQ